ncbi:MAG: hypothetical protein J3K34DRAFT_448070 [Monoraphidium minutum]|nr:MAG: hypothetical protein J3K34DRAFT_448070 [Monoraphidium minutum]
MRAHAAVLLLLGAAALAAAATAASDLADLPNPQMVLHKTPSDAAVVQTYRPGDMERQTDPATLAVLAGIKTTKGTVVNGAKRRTCTYPLNQIYLDLEKGTNKLNNMWVGSYSFNSYTFGTGAGGRNGPGTDGAACTTPPQWGPSFDVDSKCSLAPPPFSSGMVQLALYNVYYDRPGDSWGAITFVTGLKYFYGAKGAGIERQEITAQYWSPTRGFLTSFQLATGKNITDLTGKKAVQFTAPQGMVLSEKLLTSCKVVNKSDPKNPIKALTKVRRACAVMPTWYPETRRFPARRDVDLYGYKCTA